MKSPLRYLFIIIALAIPRALQAQFVINRIADTSTQIPGSAFNFTSFPDVAVELGTVVFTGQGSGIYGAYRLQNGTLEKIIAKPDSLDGKTVETVVLSTQGLNSGQVALQITFSNGSIGIYSALVGYANQTPPGGTLNPGSLLYSAATGFSFMFTGEIGRAYRIQYATNTVSTNWVTLTNFTYNAPVTVLDTGATGSAGRIYRAISP